MTEILEFKTLGGGTISIDVRKCKDCATYVCAKVCEGNFIKIKEGVPTLLLSLEEIKRGACTECLACELDCELHGSGAIRIVYPMPDLDEYLCKLEKNGIKPVWRKI